MTLVVALAVYVLAMAALVGVLWAGARGES
jgi:hypothetical protein